MTFEKLYLSLTSLPKELLLSGALCALIVLLLLFFLGFWIRRKHSPENIGLRRMETAFPCDPIFKDRPDCEDRSCEEKAVGYDPLEEVAPAPSHGTRVSEKIFIPENDTRRPSQTSAFECPKTDDSRFEPSLDNPPANDDTEPRFTREKAPWTFLETLPFRMRRGLSTSHIDIVGIGVEAVFFNPETVNTVSDPVMRLVPFLPDGNLLARESDRKTFRMGSLYAQPDAVIETQAGLLSIEYKSKGGRSDDPTNPRASIRTKDLLQTLIEAMVLSAATGQPVAPLLRTHNAVYFLRPERRIMSLLGERIVAAEDFIAPYSTQKGLCATDYAALCTVAAEHLFASPVNESNLAGEQAHRRMLG